MSECVESLKESSVCQLTLFLQENSSQQSAIRQKSIVISKLSNFRTFHFASKKTALNLQLFKHKNLIL